MINNLNSNSLMKQQAKSELAGSNDLMNLIGKNSNGLNQDLISEFTDALNAQENLNLEGDSLEGLLEEIALNPKDIQKIEGLTAKLDALILKTESNLDISKLVELVKQKPELKEKISSLLESSDKNIKELSTLKEVTKLLIKDAKTPTTVDNIDAKTQNKLKINKILGLSSEEILDNKNTTKAAVAKSNIAQAMKNSFKADSGIIKKPLDQSIVTSDSTSKLETQKEITAILDKELSNDDSQGEQSVKLDSSTIIKTNKVNEASKSMDINQILKSSDTTETVIGKIQDYIIQSKVSSDPNVQLRFNHSELGNVDLQVQKMSGDNISVTITSNSADAVKFFTENKAELLQTLTNSGLNISDLKLESSTSTNKDSNSNQNQSFADSKGEFSNSKQGQQDKESRKREELWELFDKEIA